MHSAPLGSIPGQGTYHSLWKVARASALSVPVPSPKNGEGCVRKVIRHNLCQNEIRGWVIRCGDLEWEQPKEGKAHLHFWYLFMEVLSGSLGSAGVSKLQGVQFRVLPVSVPISEILWIPSTSMKTCQLVDCILRIPQYFVYNGLLIHRWKTDMSSSRSRRHHHKHTFVLASLWGPFNWRRY